MCIYENIERMNNTEIAQAITDALGRGFIPKPDECFDDFLKRAEGLSSEFADKFYKLFKRLDAILAEAIIRVDKLPTAGINPAPSFSDIKKFIALLFLSDGPTINLDGDIIKFTGKINPDDLFVTKADSAETIMKKALLLFYSSIVTSVEILDVYGSLCYLQKTHRQVNKYLEMITDAMFPLMIRLGFTYETLAEYKK
jgi:hypothetical protein